MDFECLVRLIISGHFFFDQTRTVISSSRQRKSAQEETDKQQIEDAENQPDHGNPRSIDLNQYSSISPLCYQM